MQKHFFTFVQSLTPKPGSIIQKLQTQNVELIECFKEISKIVKKQKRKTKEELVPIFGSFDLKKISSPSSSYHELTKKYSN